jgi:hypothetical protein
MARVNTYSRWTEDEINFLIKNYSENGSKYCANILNRTQNGICGKAIGLKLIKNNLWTKEEIKFLLENYSEDGSSFCSEKLNRPRYSVHYKAKLLNLKISEKKSRELQSKTQQEKNIKKYSPEEYINPVTPEAVYFLGYFWADGNIIKRTTHKSSISLVEEDAEYLYNNVIEKINGNVWTISNLIPVYCIDKFGNKKQVRNQKLIKTYSIELFNFLKEMNYDIKSKTNFNKIFNIIPQRLKSFFILGLFDGDGCINIRHITNKNIKARVEFSSTYNYDWSTLANYLIENKIEHIIRNETSKRGNCSTLNINKQNSIKIFYELIYLNNGKIGLPRKREKFEKHHNYLIK